MSNRKPIALDLDALLAVVELAENAKISGAPWEERVELETQAERAILSAAPALIESARQLRDRKRLSL